jgi:phospho-N-acetylmuramoyl-pentapeptide-transferase
LLLLMTGLGFVGFLDDFLKIRNQRSLGLRSRAKMAGQALVAVVFAVLALQFADVNGLTPASTAISFTRDTALVLGPALFVVWAYLMVAAASNGVNLTDGLDGLATGAAGITFAAYAIIGVWQFGQACERVESTGCYQVRDPLDLAIVAAALTGACVGFLWWNTSPAKIFMGDTGSLALGGAMAGLAIMSRTELLLLLLGLLFVIITLSVILQVGSFKLRGKRVFRMAPLQHHFELLGWAEVTIVVRFWIVAALGTAGGLALFYAEWLTGTGQ